jgi:hypothetical protein
LVTISGENLIVIPNCRILRQRSWPSWYLMFSSAADQFENVVWQRNFLQQPTPLSAPGSSRHQFNTISIYMPFFWSNRELFCFF